MARLSSRTFDFSQIVSEMNEKIVDEQIEVIEKETEAEAQE